MLSTPTTVDLPQEAVGKIEAPKPAQTAQPAPTLPRAGLYTSNVPAEPVILVMGDFRSRVTHLSVLCKYSEYFRRDFGNTPLRPGITDIVVKWNHQEVKPYTIAKWLDCLHRVYWDSKNFLPGLEVAADMAQALSRLDLHVKIHQVCELAESPIIDELVTKSFMTLISNVTLDWGNIPTQEQSLEWVLRAFRSWSDEDCKSAVVDKFIKTLTDHELYCQLLPSMDREFADRATVSLLRQAARENTELKHKSSATSSGSAGSNKHPASIEAKSGGTQPPKTALSAAAHKVVSAAQASPNQTQARTSSVLDASLKQSPSQTPMFPPLPGQPLRSQSQLQAPSNPKVTKATSVFDQLKPIPPPHQATPGTQESIFKGTNVTGNGSPFGSGARSNSVNSVASNATSQQPRKPFAAQVLEPEKPYQPWFLPTKQLNGPWSGTSNQGPN